MNQKQKKTIIVGGSATLAIVLLVGAGLGIYYSLSNNKLSHGGVHEITFLANTDNFMDAGFNQATYEGTTSYGDNNNEVVGVQNADGYHDYGDGYLYVDQLIEIFQTADYVVTSGDNVGEVMGSVDSDGNDKPDIQSVADDESKTFILLDDNGGNSAAKGNNNFISVKYQAQDAGFYAGLAASVYSTSMSWNDGDVNNYVGMWGGIEDPTIAFLSGFEQGVNWFNSVVFGYVPSQEEVEGTFSKEGQGDIVKITPLGKKQAIDYSKAESEQGFNANQPELNDDNDNSWYTGGFLFTTEPDALRADRKSKKMVKDGINVMFPVAGGQTNIALNNINGPDTKIIGVDTDLAQSSPGSSDKIIGSATKELATSAEYAIWYAKDFVPAYEAVNGDKAEAELNNMTQPEVESFIELNMPDFPYEDEEAELAYKFATSSESGGWNTTQTTQTEDGLAMNAGSTFEGTRENGGVGFSTTDNTMIDDIISDSALAEDNGIETFEDLAVIAFAENSKISVKSMTFTNDDETDNDIGTEWNVVYAS